MKKLVVLSGAGISAESGLGTFRGNGGLWEGHRVEDVATPQAFAQNPKMVQDFYNMRRRGVVASKPNFAHTALAELEEHFDVQIITQNIDDLHERAGSQNILHLHGEILYGCSARNRKIRVLLENGRDIEPNELAPDGALLRPDIVWFGEDVPNMVPAIEMAGKADVFVVVGTSLNVYPAAQLVDYVRGTAQVYVIDPENVPISRSKNVIRIQAPATVGVATLKRLLLEAN